MDERPTTATVNGRLWGASTEDWAAIQEHTCLPVYEAAFDRLGLTHGVGYLDAGCGAGLAAHRAYLRGAAVSGLDAAENLLAIARRRTPDGEFLPGPLELLPFPTGAFDVVTGFNSFQYASDPKAALTEAQARHAEGRTGSGDDLGRAQWNGSGQYDALFVRCCLRLLRAHQGLLRCRTSRLCAVLRRARGWT